MARNIFIIMLFAVKLIYCQADDNSTEDIYSNNIFKLLKEHKIEVSSHGNDIQNVNIMIRRLVDSTFSVVVPAGSFFECENSGSQNMVVLADKSCLLIDNSWIVLALRAACTNRTKDIPGIGDTFNIKESPYQQDLLKIVKYIANRNYNFLVIQAAVWIVTDNADYEDLGYLTLNNIRAINAPSALMGMKLCYDAGINITSKSIWDDREFLARQLTVDDIELLKWLRSVE